MSKILKLEVLKKHLIGTYPNGVFTAAASDFKDVLGIKSNNVPYINVLIKEGFMEKIEDAQKIHRTWKPAKYKISSEVISQVINAGETGIDAINKVFRGKQIRIIPYGDQFVVALSNVREVLDLNRQALNGMIKRNKALFKDRIIKDKTLGNSLFLTRNGLVTLLVKISASRLAPEKQQEVIDFQVWAIEAIEEVIVKGFVKLTAEEHNRVKDDMSVILGTEREQIDRLFYQTRDMLGNIIYLFNQLEVQREITNKRCVELEQENEELSFRNRLLKEDKENYKKAYDDTKAQLIRTRTYVGRVENF